MAKELAKTDGYKQLVNKIQSELTELDFFIRRRTAEGYWKIGKYIHTHLLENKDRAGYGRNFYERLAEEVSRDATTLSRMVQFYRAFPILADQQELTWHHYKSLITIADKSKRNFFAQQAVRKGWTYEKLSEAIRLDRVKFEAPEEKTSGTAAVKLTVTRARLFSYQILSPSYVTHQDQESVVDVGFNNNI